MNTDLVTQLDTLAAEATDRPWPRPGGPVSAFIPEADAAFIVALVNAWPTLRDAINDLTVQVHDLWDVRDEAWEDRHEALAERDALTARLAAAEQRRGGRPTPTGHDAMTVERLAEIREQAKLLHVPLVHELVAALDAALAQRPPDTTP